MLNAIAFICYCGKPVNNLSRNQMKHWVLSLHHSTACNRNLLIIGVHKTARALLAPILHQVTSSQWLDVKSSQTVKDRRLFNIRSAVTKLIQNISAALLCRFVSLYKEVWSSPLPFSLCNQLNFFTLRVHSGSCACRNFAPFVVRHKHFHHVSTTKKHIHLNHFTFLKAFPVLKSLVPEKKTLLVSCWPPVVASWHQRQIW